MNSTRTITAIRLLSTGIMAIAAYVSYGSQRAVLLGWDVEPQSAALIPITVDLLAIICNLAIHAPGVERSGRRVALAVLVAAGAASMTANAFAGSTVGSRIAHVWTVLAYLLAEWVAAKVKATTSRTPVPVAEVVAEVAEVHPVVAVTAPSLPQAPVSPAPQDTRPAWAPPRVPTQWTRPERRPVRALRLLDKAA